MLILLILKLLICTVFIILGLFVIAAALLNLTPNEPDTDDYCEGCRYRCRNCTQDPCIVCEHGSEWQKSSMEGQEDLP